MKALIVYETWFGNTRQVAEAVARGLQGAFDVTVTAVGSAPSEPGDGTGLLVVGGPTHAFGMSRRSTRRSAVEQARSKEMLDAASPSEEFGVREWLAGLPRVDGGMAAAFDTRAPKKGFITFGSAARGIESELKKRGYRIVTKREGFTVSASEGPVSEGELERAEEWGRSMAAVAAPALT